MFQFRTLPSRGWDSLIKSPNSASRLSNLLLRDHLQRIGYHLPVGAVRQQETWTIDFEMPCLLAGRASLVRTLPCIVTRTVAVGALGALPGRMALLLAVGDSRAGTWPGLMMYIITPVQRLASISSWRE
jgi:hypothetical protein